MLVGGHSTVTDVIEWALNKFGITEGIVDDGEDIDENDDGKLRYRLTMIVEGEGMR